MLLQVIQQTVLCLEAHAAHGAAEGSVVRTLQQRPVGVPLAAGDALTLVSSELLMLSELPAAGAAGEQAVVRAGARMIPQQLPPFEVFSAEVAAEGFPSRVTPHVFI